MKIATIVGARPQFIKASAISRAIKQFDHLEEIIIHTGQHFDENMSDIFFDELQIPKPKYNLNIHSGTHGAMTGRMLEAIEEILLKESPNLTLIYGDTNSTLAGALAAAKLKIPIAHVEAGLRSFNKHMPEEINRILSDHVSDFLFAPTNEAVLNLEKEGVSKQKVFKVGDVMFDAAVFFSGKSHPMNDYVLTKYRITQKSFSLATIHRAENTNDPEKIHSLIQCLNYAAKQMKLILPLHPRTKQALEKLDLLKSFSENISIEAPLGYMEMLLLEKHARIILTDSGGVQKEAFFHNVPCITMRNETEWTELVSGGWNKLTGVDLNKFMSAFDYYIDNKIPPLDNSLYGDGHSAEHILQIINKGLRI